MQMLSLAALVLEASRPGQRTRAHPAERVAADRLHFDDSRAEVGQHRHADRRRDDRRELKNREALQRPPAGLGSVRRQRAVARGPAESLRLAHRRRRPFDLRGRLAQMRDRPQLLHGAKLRIVNRHDITVGVHLRVRHRVMRGREDLRGDVARGAEDLHPLLRRALLHPLQNPVAHLFERLRRPLRRPALPLLLGEQLGQVRRVHEGVEEVLEQVAELNPAPVRRHYGVIVERRHPAAEVEDLGIDIRPPLVQLGQQQLDEVEREHPLQQRGLDDLPAPAAIALDQRRDDPVHRALRRAMPAYGDGGESRPLAHPLPREAPHPPRLRRDQPLVRRVFRVRAAGPEAGDRAVDQARIRRRQRAVAGAQPLDRGGPERRHQHIRLGAELEQARPTIRGRQVRLDAALAAQPHRRRRQRAQRVAPGPLQLQYLSAKVAQDHRRDAADRPARKVQHPNPVQHRSHRHPPMPKLPSEYMGRPWRIGLARRGAARRVSARAM